MLKIIIPEVVGVQRTPPSTLLFDTEHRHENVYRASLKHRQLWLPKAPARYHFCEIRATSKSQTSCQTKRIKRSPNETITHKRIAFTGYACSVV